MSDTPWWATAPRDGMTATAWEQRADHMIGSRGEQLVGNPPVNVLYDGTRRHEQPVKPPFRHRVDPSSITTLWTP